jgi:hypothetical protein
MFYYKIEIFQSSTVSKPMAQG